MLQIIASSLPHNKRFLDRYFLFIEQCRNTNQDDIIFEKHHILPKSNDMFPEYIALPENIINLSYRQHYIAHLILSKAYPNSSQQLAFFLMSAKLRKPNSKHYEKIRESRSLYMTNHNPNSDGKYSKESWKNSNPSRRKHQSDVMAQTNKIYKTKPKESRMYICKRCSSSLERIEFIHHKPKKYYYCDDKCFHPNSNKCVD